MKKFTLLLIAVFFILGSYAQRPSVSLWADTIPFLIGDKAIVKMEASYPSGLPVKLEYKPDSTGTLEWLGQSISDSVNDGSAITLRGQIQLQAFDSGTFQIGPVYLLNTGTGDSFVSNLVTVRYRLADVDTTKEIKPIEGLLEVPLLFNEILPYIIAAIGLIILLWLIYYLYQRWKNKPKAEQPIHEGPKVPLHERALTRLHQLEQAGLWQQGREKEYQSELTEILREYIEERYLLPAMESTSTEILETFNRQVRDTHLYSLLERCLTIADFVKFAKGSLTGREHELAMESAREFVLSTTPAAERSGS